MTFIFEPLHPQLLTIMMILLFNIATIQLFHYFYVLCYCHKVKGYPHLSERCLLIALSFLTSFHSAFIIVYCAHYALFMINPYEQQILMLSY